MPLAFVGQRANLFTDSASMTGAVSGAIPGNLLVFACAFKVSSRIPLTDNTGNWTRALEASGGGGITNTVMWYRVASGTSADNVNFTFNGDGQTAMAVVNEYSGVAVPVILTGTPGITSGQPVPSTGIGHTITPDDADPTAVFSLFDANDTGTFATDYALLTISSPYTKDGAASIEWGAGWDQAWPTAAVLGSGEVAAASPTTGTWTGDGSATQWQAVGAFAAKLTSTGPPPGEDMDAAVSGAASILATLSPVRLFNAAVSGAASVAATLSRVALLGASISGTAAVAGTLDTFPAGADMAASVSGDAAVSATLEGFPVQPGAEMQAAVTGDASVLATLLASGGLGGALEGTASVTATLSPAPGFAADVSGSASVTATLSGVPSLAASVAAGATVEATLAGAFGLSGILAGNSFAILEAPSQFRPRFAMTIDLSPLFEENEFSFTTTWNDQVTFLSILTDFYAESIGGINIAGTDPILIAEHSLIPQVREGDSIKIEDWEWVVREVMPSNTGIVRLKLETVT